MGKGIKSDYVRIYTKDWYYNAGIAGFLFILAEGEIKIENITKKYKDFLTINGNYLEFSSSILDKFYEKYERFSFLKLFDLESYKERLNKLKSKINEIQGNKIKKNLLKEAGLGGKVANKFIKDFCGISLEEIIKDKNKFLNKLENNIIKKLENYNNSLIIYDKLKAKGKKFIDYFLDLEITKGICFYKNIKKYIKDINSKKFFNNENLKTKDLCNSCSIYKKEYDFSNAITQIIGFNKDNSNWIWGFNPNKVRICPLCALIYSCALHGIVLLRSKNNEFKNYFYFLNRNTNIETMYNSLILFKTKFEKEKNLNKPFYLMINDLIYMLIQEKAERFLENINFIEIVENEFGGQSTKSYNIFNYNITPELAKFILETHYNTIPKGGYIVKDLYVDIYEEILKKTINLTLSYTDLNNYFSYYIKEKGYYNIYNIMKYILKYIKYINGGENMDELEKIVNKAFRNGIEIAEKTESENKIKGIAYQLLNDLKIADKNAFMDKYLRLSMAYDNPIMLGSNNELTNIDNFMQFGYAFINGLLSKIKDKNEKKEVNKNV